MINMPGGPEIVVIMLVALIVLGPKELPRAMRTMGNVMAEIRKISSGFQAEMRSAMDSIIDDAPAKPHTATMAPAAPEEPAPVETTATEVVARNDGNDGTDAAMAAPSDPPARRVVDPADRAAG